MAGRADQGSVLIRPFIDHSLPRNDESGMITDINPISYAILPAYTIY